MSYDKADAHTLHGNEYIAELQAEAYAGPYLKIGFPSFPRIANEIYKVALVRGLPRPFPKEDLKDILLPTIKVLENKEDYLSEHKMQLLLEIWNSQEGWTYLVDNEFAINFGVELARYDSISHSPKICRRCEMMNLFMTSSSSGTIETGRECLVCNFVSESFSKPGRTPGKPLIDCRSSMRICAPPGTFCVAFDYMTYD